MDFSSFARSGRSLARFWPGAGAVCLLGTILFPAGAAHAQTGGIAENLPLVDKIDIDGNESFSDSRLREQMRTKEPRFLQFFNRPRYRKDFLRRDMASIEAFYHKNGFLEARARINTVELDDESNSVRIFVEIEEGERTLVDRITFSGRPLFPEEELVEVLDMDPGKPFNPSLVGAERYSLLTYYLDRGYLRVRIADSTAVRDHLAAIDYEILPGKPFRVRSIRIDGNVATKVEVVKRELKVESGELCRLDKIIESKRNLFGTGLFVDVVIDPVDLDTTTQEVSLNVKVRERKMAYVETGIGYGTVVGNRFLAEIGHRNLFGMGRIINAKVELSYQLFTDNRIDPDQIRNTYRRVEGEFVEPRLLGSRWGASIKGFEEMDATVEPTVIGTLGGGLRLYRRFGLNTQLSFGLTRNFVSLSEEGRPTEKSNTYLLSVLGSYDDRDDFFEPTSGEVRRALFDYAGGPLGGDADFYKAVLTYSNYRKASRDVVLAIRFRAGAAEPFGDSEEVPFEHRFFAGGTYSVRGYAENSLGPRREDGVSSGPLVEDVNRGNAAGGQFLLLGAAELRYPLPLIGKWNFSGTFFFDSGNVWADIRDIKLEDFKFFVPQEDVRPNDYRYSFGLGIRYDTPVGPIRLDFGIPIKPSAGFKNVGILHFGLGQAF